MQDGGCGCKSDGRVFQMPAYTQEFVEKGPYLRPPPTEREEKGPLMRTSSSSSCERGVG